jgi:hypothetical protein
MEVPAQEQQISIDRMDEGPEGTAYSMDTYIDDEPTPVTKNADEDFVKIHGAQGTVVQDEEHVPTQIELFENLRSGVEYARQDEAIFGRNDVVDIGGRFSFKKGENMDWMMRELGMSDEMVENKARDTLEDLEIAKGNGDKHDSLRDYVNSMGGSAKWEKMSDPRVFETKVGNDYRCYAIEGSISNDLSDDRVYGIAASNKQDNDDLGQDKVMNKLMAMSVSDLEGLVDNRGNF